MSRLRATSRLCTRRSRPTPIACAPRIAAITAASAGQRERAGISDTDVARRSELGPSDGKGTAAVTSPFGISARSLSVDHLGTPSTTYAKRTPDDAVLTAF